jgi:hypothetical protein
VDRALKRALHQDEAPVILAGVDYYLPIYRKLTRLRHFADQAVTGSPDAMSDNELHERAWVVAEAFLRERAAQALESFRRAESRGRTSRDLAEIVRLARRGRVHRLLLASGVRVWGSIDPMTGEVKRTAEQQGSHDDDVLDDIAEAVFVAGGTVLALPPAEMPDQREVVAELR